MQTPSVRIVTLPPHKAFHYWEFPSQSQGCQRWWDIERVLCRRGTSREKNGAASSFGVTGVAGVLIELSVELEKLVWQSRLCERLCSVFGNLLIFKVKGERGRGMRDIPLWLSHVCPVGVLSKPLGFSISGLHHLWLTGSSYNTQLKSWKKCLGQGPPAWSDSSLSPYLVIRRFFQNNSGSFFYLGFIKFGI